MDDARARTLIGAFIAALGTLVAMTLRVVRVGLRALSVPVEGRFGAIAGRLDRPDRAVQAVVDRLMGG